MNHSKHNSNYLSQHFFLLLLTSCLLLISCNGNMSSSQDYGNQTSGPSEFGAGSQNVQVFVEPAAGTAPIIQAIRAAQKSVWVEMYLLSNRTIIRALEEASNRGLDVRVMLEAHPYGSSPVAAGETMDLLRLAGARVESSNPAFALTHEKGMVIDNTTAFIMTSNFTRSALGASRTFQNREYDIIDTNPPDVQTVISIFQADWNRTGVQFNDPDIVASPINARSSFITLIHNTRHSLLVEAEELQDPEIEQTLIQAARRGVVVRMILPAPSGSTGDANSSGISALTRFGIAIRQDHHLYMHAKMMVADNQQAFVGSENISPASLDHNRELGLLIATPQVISILQQTFQQDWADSNGLTRSPEQ